MICPHCRANNDKVIDSRQSRAGIIRRRRECLSCKERFTTREILDQSLLTEGEQFIHKEYLYKTITKFEKQLTKFKHVVEEL